MGTPNSHQTLIGVNARLRFLLSDEFSDGVTA
jgi:hypothetical protein